MQKSQPWRRHERHWPLSHRARRLLCMYSLVGHKCNNGNARVALKSPENQPRKLRALAHSRLQADQGRLRLLPRSMGTRSEGLLSFGEELLGKVKSVLAQTPCQGADKLRAAAREEGISEHGGHSKSSPCTLRQRLPGRERETQWKGSLGITSPPPEAHAGLQARFAALAASAIDPLRQTFIQLVAATPSMATPRPWPSQGVLPDPWPISTA